MASDIKLLNKSDMLNLPEQYYPYILVFDKLRSFSGFMIKIHQNGFYQHAAFYLKPTLVASQGWLYRVVPIKAFLKKYRIKVFYNPESTYYENGRLKSIIKNELEEVWYKRFYDILGVFGKIIHWTRLNSRVLNFCSERIIEDLVAWQPKEYIGLVAHMSPPELNAYLKNHLQWEVYGLYEPERK